jgi:hypothetical protein
LKSLSREDAGKRGCLVLSVAVSRREKGFQRKWKISTNCSDYMLAEGRGVAGYLGSDNGTEEYIRGLVPGDFQKLLGQEDRLPDAIKPVVGLSRVAQSITGPGTYLQMLICDMGPGGGMERVSARSPRYRAITG